MQPAAMSPRRPVPLALFFFAFLLTCSLWQARAVPLGGELRCQCVELFSHRIPVKNFARINLYPAGPHCANAEVIATTTDGREVCLDPEAPWVKAVVKKILEKNHESNQP